jgi:uncharacterized protein (TIGR02145 family)
MFRKGFLRFGKPKTEPMKLIVLFAGLALVTCSTRAQTVTDIDGNVYNTVTIGNQVWMKENLKVTHYRNGDPIPNVTTSAGWSNLSTGAYCNYGNNPNQAITYGRLYNWYAATDRRQLAPEGWHVATDAEWTTLTDFAGGLGVAGGKLKERGSTHWLSPNTGATNDYGFTALPGGLIERDGTFWSIQFIASWWCSTEANASEGWARGIFSDAIYVDRGGYYSKKIGFSIRCVKDETSGMNTPELAAAVRIFPNPAVDRISIDCGTEQEVDMTMYSLNGACVIQKKLKASMNQIDISFLPTGSYIIRLKSDDWVLQRKLIRSGG